MNVANRWANHTTVQSQPAGFFQFDGLAGFGGGTGCCWQRSAKSGSRPCAVEGGEPWQLGAPDGGMGNDSIDAENMPLLAMLAPPSDSWLERRGIAGAGDLGNVADRGDTSKGLIGLSDRLWANVVMIGGRASPRWGGAAVGLGCAGMTVP